jgi:hypothetical protein
MINFLGTAPRSYNTTTKSADHLVLSFPKAGISLAPEAGVEMGEVAMKQSSTLEKKKFF